MTDKPPTLMDDISKADWKTTPESVKQLVRTLGLRVEQLERQYEELKAENERLREQVKQNSKNSSLPPSQDVNKGFKAKQRKPQGKPRGAQFGHIGHERKLYPVEQCQQVEEYYPANCIECGAQLQGADPAPYRVQSVDIPPVVPVVNEHRFHALTCKQCGVATRAWDEEIINGSGYGERVVAHVGVLSGQYRQSHRMVQELLGELFGIELSVGSINQLRQESSSSVAEAVAQAHAYVQAQHQVNLDETSFAQGNCDGQNPTGRQGWLWVMVTPLVSYFAVVLSRSGSVAQRLLGESFLGIVGSDR